MEYKHDSPCSFCTRQNNRTLSWPSSYDENGWPTMFYLYFCDDHTFLHEGFNLVSYIFHINADVILDANKRLRQMREDLNLDMIFKKYSEVLLQKIEKQNENKDSYENSRQ